MAREQLAVRERRRDERERQLIEAALSCISARGLSDTTVQAVAAEAGMAVGSISQYFENKSRLLTAVLTHLSQEFEQHWRAALAKAPADPARRLGAFVASYFSPALCQRKKIAVWFAFYGEVKAQPQYREVCSGYDRVHDEILEALCGALIADGGYGALDARTAAKLVASVCYGLWLELLTGSEGLKRTELATLARSALGALFPSHTAQFAAELGADAA
jgi:TetR/AcrR family transcriptional repressor of bet genes